MPTIIQMPQLGESVTEGTVLRWLKQPGDHVKLDEPLVEIETEKVNVELPSAYAGTIVQLLAREGDTLPVGAALLSIEVTGEAPAAAPLAATTARAAGAAPEATAQPAAPAASAAAPAAAPTTPGGDGHRSGEGATRYSPAVLRLAREHGVDPAEVPGTGMEGRVTRKDVLQFVELRARGEYPPAAAVPSAPAAAAVGVAAPAPEAPPAAAPIGPDEELAPLSATRRTIARRMLQSKQTAPHAWLMVESDVSGLVALRDARKQSFEAREGVPLTYLPFMVRAVAETLREHPRLNASFREDGILLKKRIHIGIAVDTADGLVVPVVHDADRLTVAGLAHAIHDLVTRARERRLSLQDVQGGTFTVDNTGVFGTTVSMAIINQPQVAIVTMEAIVKRPVVVNDAIAIRPMVNLCLSFDHRAVDGGDTGPFVRDLKRRMEAWSAASDIG